MREVDGKPFKCNQCGACCRWEGKVYLTPTDIQRLSEKFDMPVAVFRNTFTETGGSRIVLKNKPGSSDCVFMDGDKCGVWGSHPEQCAEWPKHYDERCPGFSNGEEPMNFKEAVERVNKKFSAMRQWEQSVSDQLYRGLIESSDVEVAPKAIAQGVNLDNNIIKVGSMDDLFAFHRADDKHLIHKSTRDLWSIEADTEGGVRITRLFDNDGEPIKG